MIEDHDLVEPGRNRSRAFGLIRFVWWSVRACLAVFLFVGALQVMKDGATRLDILKPGGFLVENAVSTLGLGWLSALLALSGSPIAATSLTLVAAGEQSNGATGLTEIQGFTMLTGSRLGAAFVVLVTAVVFALRAGRGGRIVPLSTAVITLAVTALIYVPAAFVGFAILSWPPFHALEVHSPATFVEIIDIVYGPILARIEEYPAPLIFLMGLGFLLVAFKIIDTVLPNLEADHLRSSRATWLRRKWPMFGIGSFVALVTMSVSVALTILVPLVAKRYVNRDDIIPYIMGANITTLGDTFVAALALDSPAAVRIVLAEIMATTFLSVIALALIYPHMRSVMWRAQRTVTKSPVRLVTFVATLFAVPLGLIGVAATMG